MIKGDNRSQWLRGVDVKSDGGYVILPEGIHFSGGTDSLINWLDQMVPLAMDIIADLSRLASVSSGGVAYPRSREHDEEPLQRWRIPTRARSNSANFLTHDIHLISGQTGS